MESAIYQYETLPVEPSIRLLRLDPDSTPSKPTYSFRAFPVSNLPTYYALSYTWGAPIERPFDIRDNSLTIGSKKLHFSKVVVFDETGGCTCCAAIENETDPRKDIICFGDSYIAIGRNLADFLARWQKGEKTEWIWIDAVCINQQDDREREFQVGLMGEIYSRAEKVVVWLGNSDEGMNSMRWLLGPFFDAVSDFLHKRGVQPLKDIYLHDPELRAMLQLDKSREDWMLLWEDFFTFACHRSWFSRAWVVQEATLAKGIVIWTGHYDCLSWPKLLVLSEILHATGWISSIKELDNPERGLRIDRLSVFNNARRILEMNDETFGGQGRIRDHFLGISTDDSDESMAFAIFFRLIVITDSLDASDKRDMIYSLLCIMKTMLPPGVALPIEADYRKPEKELSREISLHFLRHLNRLTILSFACGSRIPGAIKSDLPSWAMDFGGQETQIGLVLVTLQPPHDEYLYPAYNAWPLPEHTKEDVETEENLFRHDDGSIFLKGTLFGSVVDVVVTPYTHNMEENLKFLRFCADMPHVYSPTNETRAQAVSRTMIGDALGPPTQLTPASELSNYGRMLVEWAVSHPLLSKDMTLDWIDQLTVLDYLNEPGDQSGFPTRSDLQTKVKRVLDLIAPADTHRVYNERLGREMIPLDAESLKAYLLLMQENEADKDYGKLCEWVMPGRSMFRTDRGHIGIAPEWIKPGDVVSFLKTGKLPFILRKNVHSSGYKLVGEAYLHGFAYGEAMTPEFETNIKEIELV